DNGGFGCIERLQHAVGGASFNNLQRGRGLNFVAHARGLGALASQVSLAELSAALAAARAAERTTVIVVETDPAASTASGGHWWDVAVPEVSERPEVRAARERYLAERTNQGRR